MSKSSHGKDAASSCSDLEEIKKTAKDTIVMEVRDTAESVKDEAGSEIERTAQAAEAAGDAFERGSFQAEAAEQVAASLQQVAQSISQTDLKQAAGRAGQFARENPALVLGGAAVVGFAITRFLSATAPKPAPKQDAFSDPWSGHVTATDPDTLAPVATRRTALQNGDASL